ncbi:MAG: V-type ATP synthase subunit I, partial [Methanobacterium sp.]
LVLFYGLGRNSKLMANVGLILVACGVWAFILGMVTNGFIGDLFSRWITGASLPTTITAVNAFVFPQNILIIALVVGVIHINMGLFIGAYDNITRGEVREALGAQIVWFILEIGVVIAAVAYLTSGITAAEIFGIPIIILSLLMLMYLNGPYGVMDVTGFLGTVLSYARLLALCLSTGGIAMTVNILAGLSESLIPVIGIVLAPVIFVGGHIANCAFQSLGAFINSLRLHYVEFFSQFYIGGSSKFRAFRTKRKHTEIGGK